MTRVLERAGRVVALTDLQVRDVMTRTFVRVSPNVSLLEAFATMTRAHVHHLPVLDDDEHCITLLELTGVVRRLPEALVAQGHAPLVLPGSIGPLSVLVEDPLTSAAAAMTRAGVDACCAVDAHGRMVGLVTARDVLAAVGRSALHRR